MRRPEQIDNVIVRDIDKLCSDILSSRDDYVAVDTETTGVEWSQGHRAFGVAFSWDDKACFIRNTDFSKEQMRNLIEKIYDSNKTILMHNFEFDTHMIRETYGVQTFPKKYIDTLRVAYVLNTAADHSLKGWSASVFGDGVVKHEEVLDEYKKKYKIKDYSLIPSSILDPYACMDVKLTTALADKFVSRTKDMFWYDYEHRLIPAIVDIEKNGAKVDVDYLTKLQKSKKKELYRTHEKIFRKVGKAINPASTLDLQRYFFERKSVYLPDREPDDRSVDKAFLDSVITYKDEFPEAAEVAQLLIDYRKVEKQLSTYIDVYLNKNVDGFIYPNFNACATITGRLSGSKPNIQNIPRAKEIRNIFIPNEGHLYEFDYSQLEYRLAGVASSDPVIMQAYINGIDYHALMASSAYNVPIDEVTEVQRNNGKTLNFMSLYAAGPKSMAIKMEISIQLATRLLNNYWKELTVLDNYFKNLISTGKNRGYIETLLDRRIPMPYNLSYAAPNYAIQGTGGDIIKVSLIRVWELLKGTNAKIRNTVHDSIMIDGMTDLDADLVREIVRTMQLFDFKDKYGTQMPIVADIKSSPDSWGKGIEFTAEEKLAGKLLR